MDLKITFKKRLRYYFDNIIAKGARAHMLVLFSCFLILSLVSGVFVWFTGIEQVRGNEGNIFETIWSAYTHAIDPGTLGGDADWHLRLVMVLPTLLGVILVSSLVSILTTAFSSKISELKKSRSLIIEEGHTVILGWSPKVITIIKELMIAHENQAYSCIAILSDEDAGHIKDQISSKIGSTGKTRVVLRHGNPRDPSDIHIVNINSAKSIIVISPDNMESDAFVIKTVLAIVNHPLRKAEKYNIVAEISDQTNKEITEMAGLDEVTVVVSNDIIAKITVQTTRQTGLSVLYNDIIDFENVEIYILPIQNAEGRSYSDMVLGLENEYPIGIRRANAEILLNPSAGTLVEKGDKIIFIAEDDKEIVFNPAKVRAGATLPQHLLAKNTPAKQVQKTLILGWNSKTALIIKELDNYVSPGSVVKVVCHIAGAEISAAALQAELRNQVISFDFGHIKERKVIANQDLASFDDVIIASYNETYGIQEADAISIIALMHLRDLAVKNGYTFGIVTEMMDEKNQRLAERYEVDDFIVSHQVISKFMSQLSENKELAAVFDDLFDADGCEIYLKPAKDYADIGVATDGYQLSQIALAKKETCIGYKIAAHKNKPEENFGIRLTPGKNHQIVFSENDKVIVIAED